MKKSCSRLIIPALSILMLAGCGKTPPEPAPTKSAVCELLSFSLDGVPNGLEKSVDFTIDATARTVRGVCTSEKMASPPTLMTPTFTISGIGARIGGVTVGSGLARVSFAGEFDFVVEAENGDTKSYSVSLEWRYKAPPVLSGDCDLETFVVTSADNAAMKHDIAFTIDHSARIVEGKYLEWIDGATPQMLVPRFKITGQKVIVGDGEVSSGSSPVSFADDFTLTVVAENGETKEYTVSLVCPQINPELPVLHFADLNASQITSKTEYLKSGLEMYRLGETKGAWSLSDGQVEIRGRGNSTWGLPKKPYRLKFPRDYSPVGLDHTEAKSWTLLAQDMDKSLLRNHIAYGISRIMFDPEEGYHDPKAVLWSPASQHVNIYFNGVYHGLYQMSDQVERKKGRVDVDKLAKKDGVTKTGGYMLESSIHGTDSGEPHFYSKNKRVRLLMKYPKDDDFAPEQLTWIEDFVGRAEDALYAANFKDKTNGWCRWFDERTMADFIIVKELVGDMDGYTSTRCYKRDGVEKLFFGPVWDCDKGWRNDVRVPWAEWKPATSLMIKAGFRMPADRNTGKPDWFERVWEDAEFRKFVARRWASKKAAIVAYIMQELDRRPMAMAKSVKANFTVWDFTRQANNEAPAPAATYELEIARLRDYTNSRAALLDRLFNE